MCFSEFVGGFTRDVSALVQVQHNMCIDCWLVVCSQRTIHSGATLIAWISCAGIHQTSISWLLHPVTKLCDFGTLGRANLSLPLLRKVGV